MQADRTDESVKLQLPQDLVAEMNRRATPRPEEFYKVEAFKPSFFGRITEMFSGKRR